jgi:glyoxylase-like metal-dependent hydrolase (beta-lactamase superfamily II)
VQFARRAAGALPLSLHALPTPRTSTLPPHFLSSLPLPTSRPAPVPLVTIDLGYLEQPGAAAAFALPRADRVILVECGPMACLPRLLAELAAHGIAAENVSDVFVTHIHLDHAGSAGFFAQRGATIHVHPFGAAHLIDPARLVESSRRVHGAAFDRFYHDPLPSPPERVHRVEHGGEVLCGDLVFSAVETLGHARHHHAWIVRLDGQRICFSGDAAGMRVPGSRFISLPAPPPEFDLESWRTALDRMEAARIDRLLLTHFGEVVEPASHLHRFRERLEQETSFVVDLLERGVDEPAAIEAYRAWLHPQATADGVDAPLLRAFLGPTFLRMNYNGIARWHARVGGSPRSRQD